jgi:urease accessory protein
MNRQAVAPAAEDGGAENLGAAGGRARLPPGSASAPARQQLQRAAGEARVSVRAERGKTRLDRLYQDGCAKIRLPRDAEAKGLEAMLINTAGGLTGGDRLTWRAEANAGARLTVTTQACERIYRSTGDPVTVATHLAAGPDAELHWLPQETLLFDRGSLNRVLDVDLAPGARLLAVEAVVLGRTAMGEQVHSGRLRDRWRVRREGRLVFADEVRMEGAVARITAAAPLLAGACAYASLLLVADDAETRLPAVRAALGAAGGASAFDGKLFARLVARDSLALRRALIPALEALSGAALPRVWRT